MIVVFGSINIDLVVRAAKIPAPGETVLGLDYVPIPGGKGANQALAARRAGADVAMVGAYGHDSFADRALELLRAGGVDLSASRAVEAPTGAAFIVVDDSGENAIVVASGANARASAAQLASVTFGAGDILLLQRETPEREVEAAALEAKRRGAKVMLNSAPAGAPSKTLLGALDLLCVNEHEAETLGRALGVVAAGPETTAEAIHRAYGLDVIVTLGASGAVAFHRGRRLAAPAPQVSVVDTTGAGDTFVGAFAASLDRGDGFERALRRGLVAGSLACTKPGAQPSMPTVKEIDAAYS